MIPKVSVVRKEDLQNPKDKPRALMNEEDLKILFKTLQDALFNLRSRRKPLNNENCNREEWLIVLEIG